MIVYGIKNCDTMKKAFTWLDGKGIKYTFHNYQVSQITEGKLAEWIEQLGLDAVVNKKGTTYKKLAPEIQGLLNSPKTAIPIILEKTSMIKRPLVEYEGGYLLGFNESEWTTKFK